MRNQLLTWIRERVLNINDVYLTELPKDLETFIAFFIAGRNYGIPGETVTRSYLKEFVDQVLKQDSIKSPPDAMALHEFYLYKDNIPREVINTVKRWTAIVRKHYGIDAVVMENIVSRNMLLGMVREELLDRYSRGKKFTLHYLDLNIDYIGPSATWVVVTEPKGN